MKRYYKYILILAVALLVLFSSFSFLSRVRTPSSPSLSTSLSPVSILEDQLTPSAEETTKTFLNGLRESERRLIEKYPSNVRRDGDILSLRLKSGAYAELKDLSACDTGDTCLLHEFVDYYNDLAYYLIEVSFYEGGEYLLVSHGTGQKYYIPEFPEISPDRKRFVTAIRDDAGYSPFESGVYIWRFEENELVEELSYTPEAYEGYDFLEWENNNAIRFSKFASSDREICPNSDFMTTVVTLKLVDVEKKFWEFHDDIARDTVRCE
jgi:hypothetical protein